MNKQMVVLLLCLSQVRDPGRGGGGVRLLLNVDAAPVSAGTVLRSLYRVDARELWVIFYD
jgi:hypothetical protein